MRSQPFKVTRQFCTAICFSCRAYRVPQTGAYSPSVFSRVGLKRARSIEQGSYSNTATRPSGEEVRGPQARTWSYSRDREQQFVKTVTLPADARITDRAEGMDSDCLSCSQTVFGSSGRAAL